MILKRLKLSNIRSYKEQEILFPEGIVLLSGDIGSGKSTILLSIEFALFGMSKKGLSGDLLLRHGKHEGSVELHFTLGHGPAKKEVVVKRILSRANQIKQESGYIVIDGIKTECTPVELRSRIIELLGYPQEMVTKATDIIYRYTVYTPQEQMKQILYENSDVRLEILRRVFDIDKYRRINENLFVVSKDLKSRRSELIGKTSDLEQKKVLAAKILAEQDMFSRKKESLLPKIGVMKKEINEKKDKISESEQKIKQYNELSNLYAVEEAKLRSFSEQLDDSTLRMSQAQQNAIRMEADLSDFKVIRPEEVDRRKLDTEIKAQELELERIKERRIKLSKEIEFNNTRVIELSNEIREKRASLLPAERLKHDIEAAEKEVAAKAYTTELLEKISREIMELEIKKREKEMEMRNSEQVKHQVVSVDKCPTCLQDIDHSHKENISEKEDRKIKDCRESLCELEIRRREKAKERSEAESTMRNILAKEKMIDALKAELNQTIYRNTELERKQKMHDELIKMRDRLMDEDKVVQQSDPMMLRETLNIKKELLNRIMHYEERLRQKEMMEQNLMDAKKMISDLKASSSSNSQKMRETEQRMKELEPKIKALEDVEKRFEHLRSDLDIMTRDERALELELAGLDRQIDGLRIQLQHYEAEIHDKETSKLEIGRINMFLNWSEKLFTNLMLTMEKHIMMKLYHEFNELFIKWFDTLIEDENLGAKLDDSFTPLIIQNGYETKVENLSGGERSAVALAYRLALNKVINSFITSINTKDIIMLDEPTDGFSQEQLDKIKDVLDELNIRQIVIVSHESKIESFAQHIIRIAKTEHVSCVV